MTRRRLEILLMVLCFLAAGRTVTYAFNGQGIGQLVSLWPYYVAITITTIILKLKK